MSPADCRGGERLTRRLKKEDLSDKGTALFIAATLLQRQAVETLVPWCGCTIELDRECGWSVHRSGSCCVELCSFCWDCACVEKDVPGDDIDFLCQSTYTGMDTHDDYRWSNGIDSQIV